MPITLDAERGVYRLDTPDASLFYVVRDGYLFQAWWGARAGNRELASYANLLDLVSRSPPMPGCDWSPDSSPLALPSAGSGDVKAAAVRIVFADGTVSARLRFLSAEISEGFPALPDSLGNPLPSLRARDGEKAITLTFTLADTFRKLKAELRLTLIEGHNAVASSVVLTNEGDEPVRVRNLASAAMYLPAVGMDQITLSGSWGRERQPDRQPIRRGLRVIGSDRGFSGHAFNPFTALVTADSGERSGKAWGFSLVWSGDFAISVDTDQFDVSRIVVSSCGTDFSWRLEPGASLASPQAVLAHAPRGLGDLSRTYHRLYRDNLCVSAFADSPRPVLINNWEGTYFDFDHQRLVSLMDACAGTGIELFVLDDGWFGRRDNDKTSLGDWTCDRKKLPGGLEALAADAHKRGLRFGLWFEPEMISPDSDLYRAHPDWAVTVPALEPQECRNQLVIDMTREDVRRYLIDSISRILQSANVSYVKWDFNRPLTDIYSASLGAERQGEFTRRFLEGTYAVMRELTARFPRVLFEGCASGGGRYDPGMLYFMPQFWTSDDTDARERLRIQWGTSLVYPFSGMSAHVSASPNHQTGRVMPFDFRYAAALTGSFGYELDLTALDKRELRAIAGQVAAWKRRERIVRTGDVWRLRSPFEGNETAWLFALPDKSEALFCFYREMNAPNPAAGRLSLDGLDPDSLYRVEETETSEGLGLLAGFPVAGALLYGADLMGPGIALPVSRSDWTFAIIRLKRV